MNKKLVTSTLFFIMCVTGIAYPSASYMLFDNWGGTWADTEKSHLNPDDDMMCWAASASNVLYWSGWGHVGNIDSADQVFGYYQDHWTDQGGSAYYAWDWWFDGTNDRQGISGWSQVDVPGGGFYPSENLQDYLLFTSNTAEVLPAIDQFQHAGYGISLGVSSPTMAHAVTCWGFDYNPENPTEYYGIWVTDSDDSKYSPIPEDQLRYYSLNFENDKWYLDNFYGYSDVYLDHVLGLGQMPEWSGFPDEPLTGVIVPVPGSVLLGVIGVCTVRWLRKSKKLH